MTLTIWVARTLHQQGRVFLLEAFHGRAELADAVNHLLVVGFYLVNLGIITLALRTGRGPLNLQEAFEFLSVKLGLALLILGVMHFFNLFNLDRMRRKGRTVGERAPTAPRS